MTKLMGGLVSRRRVATFCFHIGSSGLKKRCFLSLCCAGVATHLPDALYNKFAKSQCWILEFDKQIEKMQLWLEVVGGDPGATREQAGSKPGATWEHPEATRQQKSPYKKHVFLMFRSGRPGSNPGATREQPGINTGATPEQPGSNPGTTREPPGNHPGAKVKKTKVFRCFGAATRDQPGPRKTCVKKIHADSVCVKFDASLCGEMRACVKPHFYTHLHFFLRTLASLCGRMSACVKNV